MTQQTVRQYNAHIVHLGCDKNRVDTERMMYQLKLAGYSFVEDPSFAHIIVVNSCAFINSARQQAIDVILEVAQCKVNGVCQKLIVTGCMSQKYAKSQLYDALPEVDAFLGVGAYERISSIVDRTYNNERVIDTQDTGVDSVERFVTTPQHYAYLKISEGCNFVCSFCTIPSIRGKYKSRDMQSLLSEAWELVDKGAKELVLVAQDLTSYGVDLGGFRLVELIEKLSQIDNAKWIRLMYCYPDLITDRLIDCIANNDKVAKYIDMPLQHINDRVLNLMGRHMTKDKVSALIDKIRKANKNISIRSSFITGFPQETEQEHQELLQFLQEKQLDNVGFFAYSREDGTPSYSMKGQISATIKKRRLRELGQTQLAVVGKKNANMIGKTVLVLYEGIDYDRQMLYGRTQGMAPDVDNLVYFAAKFADVGNFCDIKITGYDQYDLIGELV